MEEATVAQSNHDGAAKPTIIIGSEEEEEEEGVYKGSHAIAGTIMQ